MRFGSDLHQMRLGLGQVLHYHALAKSHMPKGILKVKPVLVVPRNLGIIWVMLCDEVGVTVVWPEVFKRLNKLGEIR